MFLFKRRQVSASLGSARARWKLALRLVAVAGVVLVTGVASNAWAGRARTELFEAKRAASALMVRLLATSVAAAMDFGDDEGIRTKLEDLRANAQAAYAGVWRSGAPVAIAAFGRDDLSPPARVPDLRFFPESLEFVEAVSDPNGQAIGAVVVGFSLLPELARYEATRRRILLGAGLFMALLGGVLFAIGGFRNGARSSSAFPLADGQGPGAGEVLGPYQLLTCVGQGGMGRVWAARQLGSSVQRLVAIKTALGLEDGTSNVRHLFLDEARLASLIRHPNVCGVYECDEQEGVLYQVIEWCDGATLRQLLDRTPGSRIDVRVAARLIVSVSAGLHAAHELEDEDGKPMHVVHRDVSPQNILIWRNGLVKVTDFGVAKAHGQLHSPTATGEIKGKLAYMSPEQVTTVEVDRRSDIFALGCVLYEATTGQGPFRGAGALSTLYQLLSKPITSPAELVDGYPEGLARIVLTALAKDPADRYQTAEQFGLALGAWLAESGQLVTEQSVAELMTHSMHKFLADKSGRIELALSRITPPAGSAKGPIGVPARAAPDRLVAEPPKPSRLVLPTTDVPSLSALARSAGIIGAPPPALHGFDPLLSAPPRPALQEPEHAEPLNSPRPTVPAGPRARKPATH